ncbi:hypothetical protein Tco_0139794 [Tanacetum coccineum]
MEPKRATKSTPAATATTTTTVTNAQLQEMIDQGVTASLASRDAIRSTNGEDSHNSGTRVRRNERATRECTYLDFMKCQPLNFKGTEGVVKLTQWVEKMEIVTVDNDVAYAMTWTELKKKMTDKYCPRTEIKKLKVKLWDLKVKGDEVFPAEEQPLPTAVSPTADSPGYVPESDSEEDLEEDPADGDDEDESSDDDEDDDVDIEGDKEEEEHPAPADSTAVALPVVDHAPSAEETESEDVERLLALSSPPPSPLFPWSSPLPQIPTPPLPASSLVPLPTPSPPLLLPSTDRRADVHEACLPPRKRLCFAFGSRYEVGKSSFAPTATPYGDFRRDYGFIATMDDEIMRDPERDVEIAELRAADRERQTQFTEALKLLKTLQTQLTVLQSRQGPARGPAQPDASEEAGSSS